MFKVNLICTLTQLGIGGSPSPRFAQQTLRGWGVTACSGMGTGGEAAAPPPSPTLGRPGSLAMCRAHLGGCCAHLG